LKRIVSHTNELLRFPFNNELLGGVKIFKLCSCVCVC
jgi:hypothetical protein